MFSVDNDMLIPINYMDFAFNTWRLFKHHVVGFAIRTTRKSLEEKWKGCVQSKVLAYVIACHFRPHHCDQMSSSFVTGADTFCAPIMSRAVAAQPHRARE